MAETFDPKMDPKMDPSRRTALVATSAVGAVGALHPPPARGGQFTQAGGDGLGGAPDLEGDGRGGEEVDGVVQTEERGHDVVLAAGTPLDQRQCLQHRVVQVGGDLGPFGGTHQTCSFGLQVAPELQAPGQQHQRHPAQDCDGGQQREPGLLPGARAGDHQQHPGYHQAEAGREPSDQAKPPRRPILRPRPSSVLATFAASCPATSPRDAESSTPARIGM